MTKRTSHNIRQAFILGAGLGTRLRPITDTVPKVMVPVAPGKPLLEHTIELLRDQRINDFIINLHYLPEVIMSYFGDGKKWGVRIRYSDERAQAMETGGALKQAEALLDNQFLLVYGDELHFFDFQLPMEKFFETDSLGIIVLKKCDNPWDGEVAEFDPVTYRILQWHTRPHSIVELGPTRMVNSGLYVFSKEILNYIAPSIPVKLDGAAIPLAFEHGEIFYAFPTEEPILDIGRPEQYEAGKEYYRKRISS